MSANLNRIIATTINTHYILLQFSVEEKKTRIIPIFSKKNSWKKHSTLKMIRHWEWVNYTIEAETIKNKVFNFLNMYIVSIFFVPLHPITKRLISATY